MKSNGYLASPSYTLTLRLKLRHRPGALARAMTAISRSRAAIGAVDLVSSSPEAVVRDVTVQAHDENHGRALVGALKRLAGVEVVNVSDRTFLMHLGGKITVEPRLAIKTREDLTMAYTPGVARVCRAISEHPESAWALTMKRNMIAIVTDGSRVLGLGNIGPQAALPVMEGKAMLFKTFGGVDAFPLCLNTSGTEELVAAVKALAPGFGGINLEDIEAPRCFEAEDRLRAELDIPVFHDDQHGTAVVTLAGLYNALRLVKKELSRVKIVVNGTGAAGAAIAKILLKAGARRLICFDRAGALYPGREENMNPAKEELSRLSNRAGIEKNRGGPGGLAMSDALLGYAHAQAYEKDISEGLGSGPHPFITISRQSGAGGISLARSIVQELESRARQSPWMADWRIYDRRLCEEIAADKSLKIVLDSWLKERFPTALEDYFDQCLAGLSPANAVARRLFSLIGLAAAAGKAIIVGRAGCLVTRPLPMGVHIRVTAGRESRLKRLSRRYGLSAAQAKKELEAEDISRSRLVRTHFQRDVEDPLLYDAVWNTDAVPIPVIAKLVIALADQRREAELSRRREKPG